MKKLIAILSIAAIAATAHAQTWTMPAQAYFWTNVYLHDSATPLHARVPTGAVACIDGGVLLPEGNVAIRGDVTVETNRTFAMSYKPDVSDVTNSVVIDANGQIILRRWVTGTGWIEATVNPTNPLPASMMASGVYVPLAWTNYHNAHDHATNYIKASGESRAIILGGVFTVTNKTVFGAANSADGSYATVSGGWLNSAAGLYSGVAGGQNNTAAGNYSFVAGGYANITTGSFTFAGGRRARATNEGSFVWGDSVDAEKGSAGDNTFNVYASGGFYLNRVKGLSVTQTFLDGSSGVRTNIYINGILTTGYTE